MAAPEETFLPAPEATSVLVTCETIWTHTDALTQRHRGLSTPLRHITPIRTTGAAEGTLGGAPGRAWDKVAQPDEKPSNAGAQIAAILSRSIHFAVILALRGDSAVAAAARSADRDQPDAPESPALSLAGHATAACVRPAAPRENNGRHHVSRLIERSDRGIERADELTEVLRWRCWVPRRLSMRTGFR